MPGDRTMGECRIGTNSKGATTYDCAFSSARYVEPPCDACPHSRGAEGERRADPERIVAEAFAGWNPAQYRARTPGREPNVPAVQLAEVAVDALRREGLLGAGLDLSPVGQIAMLAAKSALSRGEAPGPNTVGTLVIEIDRLRSLSGRQGAGT